LTRREEASDGSAALLYKERRGLRMRAGTYRNPSYRHICQMKKMRPEPERREKTSIVLGL
jgi:hypothetical protein